MRTGISLLWLLVSSVGTVAKLDAQTPVTQQAYLKASNAGSGDWFGSAVALAGDTAVIGAQFEASGATGVNGSQAGNGTLGAGAAYVFVRNGANWVQQAYLKASNTNKNDCFGFSVGVSGDIIVIGAPYEASNATGINGNQANNSASGAGAAYVFVRNGASWSQQAYLKASNSGGEDLFGTAVSVSGETIVVAAPREDSHATGINGDEGDDLLTTNSGAVYVYVRDGSSWSQQAYIKASNTGQNDGFGTSIAISGDTLVVGAIDEPSAATGINGNQTDNTCTLAGAVYIFVRNDGTWTQQAYIKASNTDPNDIFGASVAVSGDTVVVSAPRESSSASGINGNQADNAYPNAGAAYVFVRNGTTWTQQAYLKASNTDPGDNFGTAVAISGDTIAIGAIAERSAATGVDGNQADNNDFYAGAAYVFVRVGAEWRQKAYVKASNTDPSDEFGFALALSGDTLVVGALGESSDATGINGDQSNNDAIGAGAAYVFTGVGATCVGDLNRNGIIDLGDLAALLAHYGQVGIPPSQGDLNDDGIIDLSDLAELLALYGSSCP